MMERGRLTHFGKFKWFMQFPVHGMLKTIHIHKEHFPS